MKALLFILSLLTSSVTLSAQQRITLLFVGDLMQHQAQIDAARTANGSYDYAPCFSQVCGQISQADIAIGNLEVTLGGTPYAGYPAFSAPDEYLTAIRDAGFDVLLTANNHCLDRGAQGLERTIRMLDSLHIPHAGTYRNDLERRRHYPLFIEKNGFRIALLNYTYGTNGITVSSPYLVNYIDRELIAQDILAAQSRRPDAIIACIHWGEEYQSLPNQEQQELAEWLLQQGVTHIIGSHPHVIQPMELRADGHNQHIVAYSLGNFISNMSLSGTDGGLMLTLQLEKYPLPAPIPPRYPTQQSYSPQVTRHIPFPFCQVSACYYDLVWTARPQLTGASNFVLYPIHSQQTDSLPEKARIPLQHFIENSRTLLQQHNKGIFENKTNKK